MIKRYHEAPMSIFKEVQKVTDGDYALVHLFAENPKYLGMFKEAVKEGRDVILDNSLFELREAFDPDEFACWVKYLQPTWFIVPDSWKNSKDTVKMFMDFMKKYPELFDESCPSKPIGVAQGYTVEEVAECYKAIEPYCGMVAFNLDFATESTLPHYGVPYCIRMSVGRRRVIEELFKMGVINEKKPHHLLGCGVPQETLWYPKKWTWIRSIDTCNPVMMGMKGYKYDETLPGTTFKLSNKMCDEIEHRVDSNGLAYILYNIELMRQMCSKEALEGWRQ